jgi:hypothetical protein
MAVRQRKENFFMSNSFAGHLKDPIRKGTDAILSFLEQGRQSISGRAVPGVYSGCAKMQERKPFGFLLQVVFHP